MRNYFPSLSKNLQESKRKTRFSKLVQSQKNMRLSSKRILQYSVRMAGLLFQISPKTGGAMVSSLLTAPWTYMSGRNIMHCDILEKYVNYYPIIYLNGANIAKLTNDKS